MVSRESFCVILCHMVKLLMHTVYAAYLQNHLGRAVRRKRPQVQNVIILHDNATPHKAICVRDLLRRWRWEVLEHPLYSPELSPCDYVLIPKMKVRCVGPDFVHEMTLSLQFDAWLWQTSAMVKPMVFVDFYVVGSAQLTVLGITLKACKILMCSWNVFFINGYHY